MGPDPLSRRTLLGVAGTTALAGLAGCGSVVGDEGTRLYQLWVENVDDQPHTLHVIVEYDGEFVHWSSTELAAAETVTVNGKERTKTTGEKVEETWPDEPGRIVVRARMDDRSSWDTLDLGELDAPCWVIKARVSTWNPEHEPDLVILQTADCEFFERYESSTSTPSTFDETAS